MAGLLRNLEIQPRYPLSSGDQRVAVYVADFAYDLMMPGADWVWRDRRIVEDVKGVRTPVYRLKARLFQAQYPQIVFREVR